MTDEQMREEFEKSDIIDYGRKAVADYWLSIIHQRDKALIKELEGKKVPEDVHEGQGLKLYILHRTMNKESCKCKNLENGDIIQVDNDGKCMVCGRQTAICKANGSNTNIRKTARHLSHRTKGITKE